MRIDPIKLKGQSKLIEDYRTNDQRIMQFFDYHPTNYKTRVTELQQRSFQREALVDVLRTMNQRWDAPKQTFETIEQLKDENSVVVIGGQQAGLLTGPLYTINKVISLIQFARKQQTALNTPVIPLFWIAGEDHDFAEINHIYLPMKNKMTKFPINQHVQERLPVSDTDIHTTDAQLWIEQLFRELPETNHTKDFYETIINCLNESQTYVDFFARLIFHLFPDEDLILLDSGDSSLRKIESEYFIRFIEKQQDIANGIYEASQRLRRVGYTVVLDAEVDDAHLFYHQNNERILLKRLETGEWEGKQGEVLFTTNELKDIALNNPELLSNNVATRPIMQELLFPTLAFIGGHGEISYWALLKDAFHSFDIKMPLVVPRLSFTYVDRHIEKLLTAYKVTLSEAINDGVHLDKMNWLASHEDPPIHQMIEAMKATISSSHQPLRQVAYNIRPDIGELADKNLYHIQANIDFLERRMRQALNKKYEKPLNDFDMLMLHLHPEGGLQERVWNILPIINKYGQEFIQQLVDQTCSFNEDHYVVYI